MALLIVLIIFVVLYMVVYQVHFSTTMEEKLAQIRYGEVESDLAQHSGSLYVLTLLAEDLKQGQGAGEVAADPMAAPGAMTTVEAQGGTAEMAPGGSGGVFVPIQTGAGAGRVWYDYIRESMFNENRQQIGDITVKVTMRDGERCFDLNSLFEYARLEDEEVVAGVGGIDEASILEAVDGAATDDEAAENIRDRLLGGRSSRRGRTRDSDDDGVGRVDDGAEEDLGLSDDYDLEPEWLPPEAERIQLTTEILSRAILMVLSVNEDNGYQYSERYFAEAVARSIVEYVLTRREAPTQSRIYLTSELLNIEGITPELFFGPVPAFFDDEEVIVGEGFILKRDEFGDIAPEYAYSDFDQEALEQERNQMDGLLDEFGRFASLPAEMGFSALQSNSLTRGMTEPVIEVDDDGYDYVLEPPRPLGLSDIFTTFSTGKINLNTASLPVLFGLLTSLEEDDAKFVAHEIVHYRNKFQEEVAEEDADSLDSLDDRATPDLGQPTRQIPAELQGGPLGDLLGEGGLASLGAAGLPPEALASLSNLDAADLAAMGGGYQNLETNYFTSLQQLELVDGSDGTPDDMLRSGEGVERVDGEDDSLLRRVTYDYEKVAVFGSTYFDVELKAKPEKGRTVKTGFLTVRRDPSRGMIEILMWKELEL